MTNEILLTTLIRKYWQKQSLERNVQRKLSVVHLSKISVKKVYRTIEVLQQKAKELNLPVSYLVNTYAYFYTYVISELSFSNIYLRTVDFFNRFILENLVEFTEDDVQLTYDVNNSWNTMNHINSNELPFRVRSYLLSAQLYIGKESFFDHTENFAHFCKVAYFINRQRLNYPRVHSIKEFFLHLSIVTKQRRVYHISDYYNPVVTFEKYYKMVYDDVPREQRLEKYLSNLSYSNLPEIQKSTLWCREEAIKHLENYVAGCR